jgi:hypothetical protein
MTITYKIEEADFLTHQLYIASKSDRITKKRRKSKLIVPLAYVAFGIMSFYVDNFSLGIIFIIIAVLWFFIYPVWQRRHYINHYKGFIKENYKERLNRTGTLEIDNDIIIAKDSGSESRISTEELEKISEISSAIFLRLKTGQSLILPKKQVDNIINLKTRLRELASYLNIEYEVDDKWEWK